MKKTTFSILSICMAIVYGSTNISAQTISAGTAHTAVTCSNDSAVIDWGANSNGQLGINDTTQETSPVRVHGPLNMGFLKNVKEIVIRENFSIALRYDSTVWAWGFNGDGELGNNSNTDSWIPVQVHGPSNVGYLRGIVQISAGYAHVIALKSDGTVWAWGDNTNGELGDSTTINRTAPVQVHGLLNVGFLTGVTKIAAGQQFNLALIAGGNVLSWGLDTNGELGDNSIIDKHVPVQVHGPGNVGFLNGITSFSAGGQHALAMKADSTAWSWGLNINGELGNNTYANINSLPAQVHGPGNVGFLTGATFIKAGDYFSAVIAGDSTVWAWGFNFYGQLGVNDTTERNVPVHIHGPGNVGFLSGITEIALGDEHLIAKKSDGTYWVCGWNGNGQIGDGSTTDRWFPVMAQNPCSPTLGTPAITAENNISIYPNPVNTQLTITSDKPTITGVEIYNMLGERVYNALISSNTLTTDIDVSSQPNGVYLLRLITGNSIENKKFIIQK